MSLQQPNKSPEFGMGDILLRRYYGRYYINKIIGIDGFYYNLVELYVLKDNKLISNGPNLIFREIFKEIDNSSELLSDELKAKLL